jgi:hypothetical protein
MLAPMLRLGTIAALALLVLSADARAAKLERNFSGSVMTYTGDPTVGTHPFISKNSITGEYDFSHSGQVIAPIPSGCEYVLSNQTWVSCPAGFTRLNVNLGSGDDSVLAPEIDVPMTINAGDGHDSITGGMLADVINGQGGHDTLRGDGVFGGAASHDEIDGGQGDDSLRGNLGRDAMRGGDGFDAAYYLDRPAGQPVTISLDGIANDGAAGESDNVHGDVEQLQGGAGGDVLIGNDQANTLLGEGGNDQLTGAGGVDTFRAGAGADTVGARDGLAENVNCGDAADGATVDLVDVLSNCEQVDASGALQPDADGDGLDDPADCNDLDAAIRPGRTDVPENGIDEDCSGSDAVDFDRDRDGTPRPLDCDDGNAQVRPGAVDAPDNGVDDDCVGGDLVDLDRDDDGYARPADCDDADRAVNPGAAEIRGNAVDENCAGGPERLLRVRAEVVNGWDVFLGHTRVRKLGVRRTGGRARVVVLCRGDGCPYGRKSFKVRKPSKLLDLSRAFQDRRLQPGTTVEVRVLRAAMIAKVVRYRVRDKRVPKSTTLCLEPGAKRPRGC